VVTTGTLANVPYQSFRCGPNGVFEMNIYGDPDHPAGVEMGVYAPLTADDSAKTRCLDFVASMMGDKTDIAVLRQLNREKDLIKRGGLSLEVTPPTADDSMGGWWVSVYLDDAIAKARASEEEMKQISVQRTALKAEAEPPATRQAAANTNTAPAEATGPAPTSWTSSDLSYARPTTGSGGSVYVNGYYRRDGTYVHSYTRSSPGYGHSSGHGGRR